MCMCERLNEQVGYLQSLSSFFMTYLSFKSFIDKLFIYLLTD